MKNKRNQERAVQNRKNEEEIGQHTAKLQKKNLIGFKEKNYLAESKKRSLEKRQEKKTKEHLKKLKESLYKNTKYYVYDDFYYIGMSDIETLFDKVYEEDYYKPIKVGTFNDNYIEYESRKDKDKNLSVIEYIYKIIPYLSDMINDHKASKELEIQSRNVTQFGECKIQFAMQVNFIPSIDPEETPKRRTWSDHIEILMGSETYDIINEIIDSLFQRHQGELEESERNGSNFIFDSVYLSYHLHETSLRRGKSQIKSPEWLTSK